MKIGLGTVQFGLNYGISNQSGRPEDAEVERILEAAIRLGIDLLDTAPNYGDAEDRIGTFAPNPMLIVTKVRPGSQPLDSLRASLGRLRRGSIYGCIFHRAEDVLGPDGKANAAALREARAKGLVRKIGVSVYGAEELESILKMFTPDLVQLPANVFDQRLVRSGHVRNLKELGVEIHARSVFLQGLLLMDPERLPTGVASATVALRSFDRACREAGCSRIEAALAYTRSVPEFDRVLVGVASHRELEQIVAAADRCVTFDFSKQAVDDERIVIPSNWK